MSTVAELSFQGGGLRDTDVADGAGIAATKAEQQTTVIVPLGEDGTADASVTKLIYACHAETGTIDKFQATVSTAAVSGSMTIDLQKSTGGGAFASILVSVLDIGTSTAARVPNVAVINDTDLVEGDVLQAIVTSSSSTSEGLMLSLTTRERPIT